MVAKHLVSGASGVSWGVGTGCGGVLGGLHSSVVVFQLWPVVQSGAEPGVPPSLTMTWPLRWVIRGLEQGFWGQAGGSWFV